MKYIVGYQANDAFIYDILLHKEQIREVYFSWGDLPNGRASLVTSEGEVAYERQQRLCAHLRQLAQGGISLNLLLNANCYGRDSQSRAFFHKIGDIADHIKRTYGLATVTTSSLLVAKFFRANFPETDVRASVNMEIGSIEGLSYVKDYFTSFYLKRECNRSKSALQAAKEWCDAQGKGLYLLANSGCLNFCSAHTFHDNLVAHEAEIASMDNGYQFSGVCYDYLKEHAAQAIQRTNFIRPEDVHLYEPYTDAVKLATRVNRQPRRVLAAYVKQSYSGGIHTLLEPDHSGVLYPYLVENSMFPTDFAERVLSCDKRCETCDYCMSVFEQTKKNLGEIAYADKSDDQTSGT